MKITNVFGSTLEDVLSGKHNVLIGVSLGNQYFSRETVRKYVEWGLEISENDVAILAADSIHAINYEVLNGYSRQRAASVAARKGKECLRMAEKIKNSFPKDEQRRIIAATWADAEESEYYQEHVGVIRDHFNSDLGFRDAVISQVRANLGERLDGLPDVQLDRLSQYLLHEMAAFLNGVELKGQTFDLNIYPGTGFGPLITDIQEGKVFSALAKAMDIERRVICVEGYVD